MCNIHGIVTSNKRNLKAKEYMSDGFLAGQVRGTDSAGMVVIDTVGQKLEFTKLPVCGSMFIQNKHASNLLSQAADAYSISIGHCRAATSGKIGLDQAHPFYLYNTETSREFVGVHNGTLNNWQSSKDARYYDVDSEWALAQIFEHGEEAFATFKGAYAFAWWDNEEAEVINFALNDQRTLFVMESNGGELLFASEAGMMFWLAERNGFTVKDNIVQLEPGYWYKFNVSDVSKMKRKKLPEPKTAYSRSSSYTYEEPFKALDRIFGVTEVAAQPRPPLIREEVENAKVCGIFNLPCEFIPSYEARDVDGRKEIWGTVAIPEAQSHSWGAGTEFEAVIRNANDVDWHGKSALNVVVLGVSEAGHDMIAVCSKPKLNVQAA